MSIIANHFTQLNMYVYVIFFHSHFCAAFSNKRANLDIFFKMDKIAEITRTESLSGKLERNNLH